MTKPVMVAKSHRFRPDLYAEAEAKADERDETLSDVLRAALERYVQDDEEAR